MQAVNKKMDPQKTLQTMQDFQKENMKMGMTEDMSKTCYHWLSSLGFKHFKRMTIVTDKTVRTKNIMRISVFA
jgi:hypothetical protein